MLPPPGPLELLIIVVLIGMIVGSVVVAVLAAPGLARLVRREPPDPRGGRRPAMDALSTRFANGEIDAAEYERLRTHLQRS